MKIEARVEATFQTDHLGSEENMLAYVFYETPTLVICLGMIMQLKVKNKRK